MSEKRQKWKRGTASEFTSDNQVLLIGEPAIETDTGKIKIGDGSTAWTSLYYWDSHLVGDMWDYAGAVVLNNYRHLICNGQTIGDTGSGATNEGSVYETLFNIVKTGWGNAGTESFSAGDTVLIPDLRGAFRRGTGSHGTETMADGNPFAGPAIGSYEDDQFQGHYHTDDARKDGAGVDYSSGTDGGFSNASTTTPTTGVNGAVRSGDETRPFSAGVTTLIKF